MKQCSLEHVAAALETLCIRFIYCSPLYQDADDIVLKLVSNKAISPEVMNGTDEIFKQTPVLKYSLSNIFSLWDMLKKWNTIFNFSLSGLDCIHMSIKASDIALLQRNSLISVLQIFKSGQNKNRKLY